MARQEPDGPLEVPVGSVPLDQYQLEMADAVQMPLPDVDWEDGSADSNALENFDFDSFLHTGDSATGFENLNANFNFDSAPGEQPEPDYQVRLKAITASLNSEAGVMNCLIANTGKADDQIMLNRVRLDRIDGGPKNNAGGATPQGSTEHVPAPKNDDEILALLIKLQTFEGSWELSPSLFVALSVSVTEAENALTVADQSAKQPHKGYGKTEWATALVIVFMEDRLDALKGSWELMVDKAKNWLGGRDGKERLEEILASARAFYKRAA